MMEQKDRYIRFDWAVKRLLRNKANFGVLEGFLTVLLGEPIRIVEILESEGNQLNETDKFNRVDIKARNSKDEIINDMMISMTLQDDTTLDHLIEEYYRRESLDHRLFTLQ